MGRSAKYYKNLNQQAYDKLTGMQAFGESKKDAIADGTAQNKIFSHATYKTYWQQTKAFIRYVEKEHPETRNLKQARQYVREYLQKNVDEGKSAWTIQTQSKALGKLYGITPDSKDYFEPPVRHRADIVRSRGEAVRDRHFSEKNNDELIRFCKGVGARREGMTKMTGKDLMTREQIDRHVSRLEKTAAEHGLNDRDRTILNIMKDAQRFEGCNYYVYLKEKGGRERISPIIGPDTDKIVERFKNTGRDEKVWKHVSTNADIHGYRGEYATRIYRKYARDVDELKKNHTTFFYQGKEVSSLYICRKDERGKVLDKQAMEMASKALGHNRLEVVANNYIRGL